MSKAVLISIRPEWCQKIMAGRKTIEVRKTRPKMDTPFKCYIYRSVQSGVIGEFVCDDIFERIVRVGAICEPPKYCICDWNMDCTPLDTLLADACLTKDELEKYLDGGVGYGSPPPTLRRCDMGGGFTMMTVYSLVVNAATQNLTTAIIADYVGRRWTGLPNERAAV